MEHRRLAAQLCRALRGPRSQAQLARRLGNRSNVAADWEAGRTAPPATTFFRLCRRLGVVFADGLRAFLSSERPWTDRLETVDGVAELVRALRGRQNTVELAARSGVSRHALGRWQRAQAEPRLPDLLRVVSFGTGRLLDFVDVFVDPADVPLLTHDWERLLRGRRLLVDSPWVQPVLLALELADYQALPHHDDAWLGARLDLDPVHVVAAIEVLSETDQITWTGTHWQLGRVLAIDTRRDAEGVLGMRAWFAEQALARLRSAQPDATFSQNLVSIAEADLAKLRELHVAHFREVQQLVAKSAPSERIVLLQRFIVPLDVPEPATRVW
ncbi:MAG: helix-turn-helix domain-containing protein [Myxococcota bacterium]